MALSTMSFQRRLSRDPNTLIWVLRGSDSTPCIQRCRRTEGRGIRRLGSSWSIRRISFSHSVCVCVWCGWTSVWRRMCPSNYHNANQQAQVSIEHSLQQLLTVGLIGPLHALIFQIVIVLHIPASGLKPAYHNSYHSTENKPLKKGNSEVIM